jgi:hypothetical protein
VVLSTGGLHADLIVSLLPALQGLKHLWRRAGGPELRRHPTLTEELQ